MTGVAVKGKDRAGGKQDQQANGWFRINGDPIVTVGDTVEGHGSHGPAVMVEGEDWFRVGGRPVCRAEHKSSCGHATTGRQRFRLVRAGNGYRDYLTSAANPCNVEHIPWIMRANGWHEGAKLMDRWFSLPASTDKSAVPPDTSTVSMDFILSFADVQPHYQDLLNPQNWTVPNDSQGLSAIQRLCKQLATRQLLTDFRESFDDFHLPVPELRARKWQIDTRHPPPTRLSSAGRFECGSGHVRVVSRGRGRCRAGPAEWPPNQDPQGWRVHARRLRFRRAPIPRNMGYRDASRVARPPCARVLDNELGFSGLAGHHRERW